MAGDEANEFLCKVCGEAITLVTGGVSCRSCSTLHHRGCWEYARSCSVYACGELRFVVCDPDQLQGELTLLPAGAAAASDESVPALRAALVVQTPRSPVPDQELDFSSIMRGTLYCPECHAVNPAAARSCAFCDYPIAKASLLDPTVMVRRPATMTPAAVLIVRSLDRIGALLLCAYAVSALCNGLGGLWGLASTDGMICGNYLLYLLNSAFQAPVLLIGSLLLHLVGSFYEMGLPWARRVQLPVSLFLVLFFPFGTILGTATLICWLAPSAAVFFRHESGTVPALMP